MENEVSKRTLIIISVITGITILLVMIISVTTVSNEDCIIDIHEDFTNFHPLLLQPKSTFFLLPNNGSKIILSSGDSLLLACPGQNNYLKMDGTALVEITCAFNKTFLVNFGLHSFKDLNCTTFTEPSVKISEKKCAEKYMETEIGFNTTAGFIHLITTCFDNDGKDSLYSVHELSSKIKNSQVSSNRPNFTQGNFYPNLQLDNLYRFTTEKETFKQITGKSVDKYINKDNYFNKGHLAPTGDFIYLSQKRATFFYVNIAPQWSKFNGGNWNNLEQSCRNFAADQNLDLFIYTGIYGIASSPDKQHSLSLYVNANKNLLKVPQVFWKIVYDPATKRGIVFIGHNNPLENGNNKPKSLCTNVCDRINWVTWKADDINLGYSYCCEYAEVKKIIKYLPDIQVEKLLIKL